MSDLDEAMMEHMAYTVLSERRAFCFRDFLTFDVNGEEYHMVEGTIRNKFSELKKSGVIELEYNSGTAFYTLTGHRFGKPMTPTHTGVNSNKTDSFIRLIQDLPMGNNGLHDIRLRFEVVGIWKFLLAYHPELHTNSDSEDILMPTYNIDDTLVGVTVHKTDTVSVSLACSLTPVSADISGIIRLSNTIVRIEERVGALLARSSNPLDLGTTTNHLRIPDHKTWIVTMWHFGADSLTECSGEKFHVSWETGRNILVRAYTKIMKDKKVRIRLERQEYPRKTLQAVVEERSV
jgi:hypothetical protein